MHLRAPILASFFLMAWPVPTYAVDWNAVPAKDITLFYPAQLSWEWLNNADEHSGAPKIAQGRTCRSCHDGKEAEGGALLVDYKPTEPTPIANKPGAIKATIKTAHDNQTLFVQVQFNATNQPNAGQDKLFTDKVAVMIDDGSVEEAQRVGCWAACHDDAASMKNAKTGKTKYIRGADSNGRFMEYWQARLKAGTPAQVFDGIVSDHRAENAAPRVKADAAFKDGLWTVVFSRALSEAGRKPLTPGKRYTLGFSIHAGHTAQRFHYVSLEKTLSLDNGSADFVATRQ